MGDSAAGRGEGGEHLAYSVMRSVRAGSVTEVEPWGTPASVRAWGSRYRRAMATCAAAAPGFTNAAESS